jgi:hypothetical protein
MNKRPAVIKTVFVFSLVFLGALTFFHFKARAGNPHSAYYSSANDRLFWFIHISDIHMGESGTQDSDYLTWIVTEAKAHIDPNFFVATGDLTDSTNGGVYPDGPHLEEWNDYNTILSGKVDAGNWYDLPGNHEAYNDQDFSFYVDNSIQGVATGQLQHSWIRDFGFGKYHFLGINTAGNTGDPFIWWARPWGDPAGLDSTERQFIENELTEHSDADLTLIFGHHPIVDTGVWNDTWIGEGASEFVYLLDQYGASVYRYGHVHRYAQEIFTGTSETGYMTGDGVHYISVDSLGESADNHYSVVAVDCNGLSYATQAINTWPVVLITAPLDRYVGGDLNPYAYTVPDSFSNPIRALVFDAGSVSQVQFRVDGSTDWTQMSQVTANPKLWEGVWDASGLSEGEHTLEVQAQGTSTRSDIITVYVTASMGNTAPVASDDSYSVDQDTTLSISAPGVLGNDQDANNDPLTANLIATTSNGTLLLNLDGSFDYTPNSGYTGADSFTYVANDGSEDSNVATVSITVDAVSQTDEVTVLAASYNPKPRKLQVEATSTAQPDAQLEVVGYGPMTFNTTDQIYVFNQRVSPAPGDTITVVSNLGGSDTFNMSGDTNSPPVAYDQNVTVQKNTVKSIALSASDPDGDPLSYAIVTGPSNGALSGTAPDLTYTPDSDYTGPDSFTFKANDGQVDSNVATVSIIVTDTTTDTVIILLAEYKARAKRLTVEATSTAQPDAVLTLVGYGEMTYSATDGKYIFQGKASTPPGDTVTVTSSLGGSATATVTVK